MKNYNKQDFYKNGFYVIRNLLNEDEIKKYISYVHIQIKVKKKAHQNDKP